jgi:hypothetical protein
VTRVSLLIDTDHIYSDPILQDLRPSPPYEFGKKRNLSEQFCDIRKHY